MSRILLLTNIYPIKDISLYGTTSVCHYFSKVWQEEGNEIEVIYLYTYYPRIFHFLGKHFYKLLGSLFGTVINSIRFNSFFSYKYENINVNLVPIFKKFPKSNFSFKVINSTVKKIETILKNKQFYPDIIIGHFLNPNIDILPKLKQIYQCPVTLSLHGEINNQNDINKILYNKDKIDIWGFRSLPIKKSFITNCFIPDKYTFCFSGVPEYYINKEAYKKFYKKEETFLYVGNLIKRKFPLSVLWALKKAKIHFDLTYIGEGNLKRQIQKLIKKENLRNVHILGHLKRQDVLQHMADSKYFIMISKGETFGLVYLEAMSQGCIVIASKNEGMEGIIQNGVNGFLCSPGDTDELTKILINIESLSTEEKINISRNAISTVLKMTDKKVANYYLSNIKKNDF